MSGLHEKIAKFYIEQLKETVLESYMTTFYEEDESEEEGIRCAIAIESKEDGSKQFVIIVFVNANDVTYENHSQVPKMDTSELLKYFTTGGLVTNETLEKISVHLYLNLTPISNVDSTEK
jgi:hypothetical protein